MKYKHPTITVTEPAPGHFAIEGHNPRSVFIEGEGHVVPPGTCYISPEIPNELLAAIIEERGGLTVDKPKRGRPPKAEKPAEPEAPEPAADGGEPDGSEFEKGDE